MTPMTKLVPTLIKRRSGKLSLLSLLCAFCFCGVFSLHAQTTTSLLDGGSIINELLPDPNGANNFDTDGNGSAETNDEFIELFNNSGSAIDLTGWEIWDETNSTLRHVFGAVSVPANGFAVVIGAVQTDGNISNIAGDVVEEASSGSLSANNGDDVFILYDPNNDQHIVFGYNGATAINTNFTTAHPASTLVGSVESASDSDGLSMSRNPDGDVAFSNQAPTPGESNLLPVALFTETFEDDPFNRVVGKWSQFSATGDGTIWTYQVDDQRVRMNAFPEGCAGDDWLISPVVSLSGASDLSIMVNGESQFDGNDLRVYYAADYDPNTNVDPTSATLVELDMIADLAGRGPFDISYSAALGSASGNVNFFVRYESSGSCAEWLINDLTIQAETITGPIVQFTNASFSGREGVDATIDLDVEILVAPMTEQTIEVSFVTAGSTGTAADIDNFSTQTLTFPAGGMATQSLSLAVTDDMEAEGTEILIFELQNASASLVVGTQNQASLALGDDDFVITPISQIRGEGHMSDLVDQDVKVQGIVTGIFDFGNGFYVQDIAPDDNLKTSEAIYVAFGVDPTVSIGEVV